MITGLLTPSPDSTFTYPASIKKDLTKDKLGEYIIEQVAVDDIPKNLYARYAPEKLVKKINDMTISHETVTTNLMKKYDWDFAMVVFRGTDDAQHLLWYNKQAILSCYKTVDDAIGKMIETFPTALFIIVSDHGFATPKKYLYVNNVLYNHGYIHTRTDPAHNLDNIMLSMFDIFSKAIFHLVPLEKLVRTSFGRKFILTKGGGTNIDFSLSKVMYHSVCSRGIRILLKEKYPQGTVDTADYEKLREELITLFTSLTDPETGQPIIKKIYRGEELYGKDAVNDPLDLILEPTDGYSTQELLRGNTQTEKTSPQTTQHLSYLSEPGFYDWAGDHHPDGIIFMYGSNIQKNKKIKASVFDIAPTILAALHLPIPDIIDGTVIQDAFYKQLSSQRVDWKKQFSPTVKLSEKEQTAIQRLRKQGV
jgi:predicted AlkP superfamily phosphohydrolase/phosphomutase